MHELFVFRIIAVVLRASGTGAVVNDMPVSAKNDRTTAAAAAVCSRFVCVFMANFMKSDVEHHTPY